MNKKNIIILIVISIFLVVIIRKIIVKANTNNLSENEFDIEISNIVRDEQTGEYVIYDVKTGMEVRRSQDEADLYIYEVNPDYNPRMQSP